MSVPVNQPLNLGLATALDRLGLKQADFPDLTPVLVVADISQTVSSELLEARRQSVFLIGAIAAQFSVAVLYARSPGGLVVESLFAAVNGAAPPAIGLPHVRLQVLVTPQIGALVNVIDIGGLPGVSITRANSQAAAQITPAGGSSALICANNPAGQVFWAQAPARIYVPPASALVCQPDVQNSDLMFSVVWRELADIQGVP